MSESSKAAFPRSTTIAALLLLLPLLLAATSSRALRPEPGAQAPESAAGFVQSFLDWYVPLARGPHTGPAFALALRERPALFSPYLTAALDQNLKDRNLPGDNLIGTAFDPFLAAVRPCASYVTGRVTDNGAFDDVEIYGVCAGKRQDNPDVIAELERRSSTWMFANFRYANGGTDLLTLLGSLAQ